MRLRPELRMYDSADITQIPRDARYVAAYVNGNWPTIDEVRRGWPKARVMGISVSADHDAECLDVELGDARVSDIADWVYRQLWRGAKRPCIYADLSTMPAVRAALNDGGIHRTVVRLWVADWHNEPTIPPGYGGCQWTSSALGRNLDESRLLPGFFTGVAP